ncbi:hypothetical protein SLA2020_061050 [Shorea laevis]
MAGSRVQINKAHKSRFCSKSSRNLHKTSLKSRIAKSERNATNGAHEARCPPRVIVLFPLSASVNLNSLAGDILKLLSTEGIGYVSSTVASSEYRLRVTVLQAPYGDLLSCMEMAADFIAFVASANCLCEEGASDLFDSFGNQCLSVFRSIGLTSTAVLICDCKFYSADTRDDLHMFMWLFKEQRLTAPHWQNQRPYLIAQEVVTVPDDSSPGKSTLLLTGFMRAHSLSVNQLVCVSGAGDFQLSKIEILKDPFPLNARKEQDAMDSDELKDAKILLPENRHGQQKQKWLRLVKQKSQRKRILPHGTSEYQAAWIVDDKEEDSDTDNDDNDGMVLDEGESGFHSQGGTNNQDFEEDQPSLNLRDSDDETENDSVMMEGENPTREQLEQDIQQIKQAHAEDEEFADEVDTPLDVPARKRFAKYRGLKSFRTSSWDLKESLPPEYPQIFAFDNFTRTQKDVIAKALEMEEGDDCAPPDVCPSFHIKKHDSYDAPIKSKEELIFHVGFRQFLARPVFSTDNFNSNKHKMERFLHTGCFSMASINASISFPSLPLIALKASGEASVPIVAAVGSLKNIDPDRIILKKIILTGYPQRDVRWFKPVEVWIKCGRRGRIKEPIDLIRVKGRTGNGIMKCVFNGVLQQHDTVCLSIYKRAYPKWPEHRFPLDA